MVAMEHVLSSMSLGFRRKNDKARFSRSLSRMHLTRRALQIVVTSTNEAGEVLKFSLCALPCSKDYPTMIEFRRGVVRD
jgi:hypothetical protein